MFVFSMVAVILGYTIMYYGVSMWQAYSYYNGAQQSGQRANSLTNPGGNGGIPLSYLITGKATVQQGKATDGSSESNWPTSWPPFNFSSSTSTSSNTTGGTGAPFI